MLKNSLFSFLILLTIFTLTACTNATPANPDELAQVGEQYSCETSAECALCDCSASSESECVNHDWWQANDGKMKDCLCDPSPCECSQNKCQEK
ncbi:hypothetical protein HQ571_06435 [Candidatus Kuenenbacteria bacterium]|nr:hypothetical protein [Candidatus Kuenenbacteria bacterium]